MHPDLIITESAEIKKYLKELEFIGETNILIEGETGVGKTPIARFANRVMGANRPFIRLNCGAISRENFCSELFGHVKGAYTGAYTSKRGLVEEAEGGDLFLDEIGDLSLPSQAVLLVFLDNGEFRRMGDNALRFANCRIICATNKDLTKMLREGSFRKDLYSRISHFRIEVPPLRERVEDIIPIAEWYFKKYLGDVKIEENVKIYLKNLSYRTGNVRELIQIVKNLARKSINKKININFQDDLFKTYLESNRSHIVYEIGYKNYMKLLEKQKLMEFKKNVKSMRTLAKDLKINYVTLTRRFKEFNISLNI